jgi:excisionase family DNA binding protein
MALRDDEKIGFTVKQVAEYFSTSEQSIRRAVHCGELAAITFGRKIIIVDPGIHRLVARFHGDEDELEQVRIDEAEARHADEQYAKNIAKREAAQAAARAEAEAAQAAASASGASVHPGNPAIFLPVGTR